MFCALRWANHCLWLAVCGRLPRRHTLSGQTVVALVGVIQLTVRFPYLVWDARSRLRVSWSVYEQPQAHTSTCVENGWCSNTSHWHNEENGRGTWLPVSSIPGFVSVEMPPWPGVRDVLNHVLQVLPAPFVQPFFPHLQRWPQDLVH